MKQLGFAILLAVSIAATPAYGQALGTDGYQFVEAVRKNDGNKAISLLESHPKGFIDTRDAGDTALIIALSRSDEQWTGFLLNKGADPNLPGKGGDTPLIAASRVGFGQAVEWLLSLGARVDAGNRSGETPLIIAVQQRDLAIARMLLNRGANPDKSDAVAGFSARDYATRDPRAREILKLIEARKPKAK